MFWMNIPPPSSGTNSKHSKKPGGGGWQYLTPKHQALSEPHGVEDYTLFDIFMNKQIIKTK